MKRKLSFSLARVGAVASAFALASLVVAPAVATAATATTVLNSTLGAVITLFTSTTPLTLDVAPDATGKHTTRKDTLTVSTNDSLGYTITLADADANTNMISGANNIAAHAGTWAAPTTLTANKWGYRIDSAGSFGAGPTTQVDSAAFSALLYAGVPATGSPQQIRTTNATASNETTDVWYAVGANTSQPTGTYTDSVTYSCTAD